MGLVKVTHKIFLDRIRTCDTWYKVYVVSFQTPSSTPCWFLKIKPMALYCRHIKISIPKGNFCVHMFRQRPWQNVTFGLRTGWSGGITSFIWNVCYQLSHNLIPQAQWNQYAVRPIFSFPSALFWSPPVHKGILGLFCCKCITVLQYQSVASFVCLLAGTGFIGVLLKRAACYWKLWYEWWKWTKTVKSCQDNKPKELKRNALSDLKGPAQLGDNCVWVHH